MAATGWAKRYAQAVFEIATSAPAGEVEQALDTWSSELDTVIEALSNPEFLAFLRHAKVPRDKKVAAINEVLPQTSVLVRNMVSLMVSKGIVEQLPQVKTELSRLVDRHRGIERVKAYSAVALDQSDKDRIREYVKRMVNKDVALESEVDPSIIGGLVIRVGDKLLDGSTRTKLLSLKSELESASLRSGNPGRSEEANT